MKLENNIKENLPILNESIVPSSPLVIELKKPTINPNNITPQKNSKASWAFIYDEQAVINNTRKIKTKIRKPITYCYNAPKQRQICF